MKSIRLHGKADFQIHDEPEPVADAGQKIVQVKAVGVCGSDIHWFVNGGIGDAVLQQPLILGHEFAGVTREGQRVAVDPALPCGQCEPCLRGHPNLCRVVKFAGHADQDGALCEAIAWDAGKLFDLPDSMSFEEGAMLEPLGVALHAVNLAHLEPGMSVAVLGCGPIGLLIIQLVRLAGIKSIYATDLLSHRLSMAKTMGANQVIQVQAGADVQEINAVTAGAGVDVCFEAAGEQAAVDTAITSTSPGGKVLLIGIPDNDRTSFSASTARRKGLTIRMVRRMKNTYPQAIDLVSRGQVDLRSLITHRFSLENTAQAFGVAQRREGIKVIIEI